jgi:DNA-directed RNA polymerase
VTPTGFPVSNRYLKSKADRVKLPFLGQSVLIADSHTDKIKELKVINSAVANVVHSLDSSHLARSVNRATAAGITNVLTIHDCFGALAPDTEHFAYIRRFELANMYVEYQPLAVLRASNLPSGTNALPLPEFGRLDPRSVALSEYLDR